MLKVWVVGAQGMVGQEVVRLCQRRGIEVVGSGHADADVCDLAALRRLGEEIQPTHLINCAAIADVDRCEREPENAFAINAQGAEHCAQVAKGLGARFIHVSTDYVFDTQEPVAQTEEALCAPVNVYGISKWEAEKRITKCFPQACIVRTAWVFGGKGKNLISGLLQRFATDSTVRVVDDQWGRPTYCPDLAEALLDLKDATGVVHFCNEGAGSRYQVACLLWQLAQKKGRDVVCKEVLPVPSSTFPTVAKRPRCSILDTGLYTRLTGKQPRSWIQAAEEYLQDAL